jgi:hypothetical protein
MSICKKPLASFFGSLILVSSLFVSSGLISQRGQLAAAEQEVISIDDFAFLKGFWQGTGFGGKSEEMWMPPVDGRMFGIFKQSENSELVFTEFMEILESDGGFILRLKHFNPDFSGLEEKNDYVTFKLSSLTKTKAVFAGLSYEIIGPDALRVELKLHETDGRTVTEVFDFSRSPI